MAALSPSSRNRARVIREMAKDLNRTNHSVVSSTGSNHGSVPDSTLSDFDPENEALMSTRQLENTSQQLPELRASAKKFSRYTRPEMDFVIDTSALGRAFPDFTGGGSSSEDSVSIEVSRGKKANKKASYNVNDSVLSSKAIIAGNYEVVSTPPMKSRAASSRLERQDANRNHPQAQRNIQSQSGPQGLREKLSKTTAYGSSSSGQSNGRPHRTLAELHARVRDENDESFLAEDPPPTTTFTAKTTRFGSVRGNQNSSQAHKPTKTTNPDDLYDVSFQQTSNAPIKSHGVPVSATATGQHSFVLPDLPNISELVSGVYPDGTPVFSRSARAASRFSASTGRSPNPQNNHLPLDGIPIPEEERAIFISLKLLQDKVAGLENEKARAEKIIDELKFENSNLKAESKRNARHHRSDSALGLADSDGGDGVHGSARIVAEKSKLESHVRSLQEKLDAATRKVSVTEINIKNLSRERDALMSQVGVAYYTTEDLKSENETLRKENAELRKQLGHVSAAHDDETQTWAKKEAKLRRKAERRAEAVKEVREMTREIFELQHSSLPASKLQRNSTTRGRRPSDARITGPGLEELRQRSRSGSRRRSFQPEVKHQDKKVVVESYVHSEDGDSSVDETIQSQRSRKSSFNQKSITGAESSFESVFPAHEMAKLRQILADERVKRNAIEQVQDGHDTIQSAISNGGHALPRKSSMKRVSTSVIGNPMALEESDFTGGIAGKRGDASIDNDLTNRSRASSTHRRRHSDISISSKAGNKARHSIAELTSAFIIPDITMQGLPAGTAEKPTLSVNAQRVLDGIARHDGHNCTVCNRYTSVEKPDGTTEEVVKVSKPVPTSDRRVEIGPEEGEPTLRPAQSPALALATVMKGLEDELAHLKIELAQYQALYTKHDPALSKRRRKSVQRKIEGLVKAVDTKSDQIYALYDVLEGQKESGQEMSEAQFEVTLNNIGIDVSGLGKSREQRKGEQLDSEEIESSSDEDDMDLPWEGIDETDETNRSRRSEAYKRRSWA